MHLTDAFHSDCTIYRFSMKREYGYNKCPVYLGLRAMTLFEMPAAGEQTEPERPWFARH